MDDLQTKDSDGLLSTPHSGDTVRYHEIGPDSVGRRLDNYLIAVLKGVPKSHIYRIIRSGEVRIDGGRAKPSQRLRVGERLRIPPVSTRRPAMPLDLREKERSYLESRILYEDESLLVLDKPSGFSVHAGSRCNFGLAEMFQELRHSAVQPAHRLDRNTSGCLIFAKHRQALLELHRAFRDHQVRKTYLILAKRNSRSPPTAVTAPLTVRHSRRGSSVMVDYAQGQPAETRFEVVEEMVDWILLKAYPLSGRMHQIRVHAAHIGYPVAGDGRYGDFAANKALERRGLKRMFLHAARLEFECEGKHFDFTAPLAEELERVVNALRQVG